MSQTVHLNSLEPGDVGEWNAATSSERTLDAAWLILPNAQPRQNVRLRFAGSQLVDQSPVPDTGENRLPPLAVIPPLINAHTHLEFSTLNQQLQPTHPFPDWIRSVIRWRLDHPDIQASGIEAGLQECRRHAVAAIGEITTSDDAVSLLHGETAIVSFRELIGLLPDNIPAQLETMQRHLRHLAGDQSPSDGRTPIRIGISPHAPYSVHPDLFSAVVDSCREQAVPVAMHLAETPEELELLDSGTGHFADFLKELNLWQDGVLPRGGSILSYLRQLATLPRSLAVHCNYLTSEEIRFLGSNPQVTVVYCPRTHAWFEHPEHPWRTIRQAGGTVVLGTDGRGSNPDLSIWNEVLFLASRFSDCSVEELLPLVTVQSAAVLGLQQQLYSQEQFHASLIQLPESGAATVQTLLSPQSRPVGRLLSSGTAVRLLTTAD